MQIENDFLPVYTPLIETIHETFPESEKARKALDNQNGNFLKLAQAFDEYWGNYDGLLMYAPDHGCCEREMFSLYDFKLAMNEERE